MDPAIATIIGAIIGACLTGPATYYFSKCFIAQSQKNALDIIKRHEFNKASSSFRKAFTKEIRLLSKPHTSRDDYTYYIIRRSIVRHENAAIIFKNYLCNTNISGFDKAWKEYNGYRKDIVTNDVSKKDISDSDEKEEEIRKQTIHRIYDLLDFAKAK